MPKPIRIKAILNIIVSNPNMYGNTYTAFRYIDTDTSREAFGKCGSGSGDNIRDVIWELNGGTWESPNNGDAVTYTFRERMAIREFNSLTKEWPYVGSLSEEIAEFIRKELSATE